MSGFYDHFISPLFFLFFMFGAAITLTAVLARKPKNKKK